MALTAIVDIRDVDAPEGPATPVAGLSLLDRTARLAIVAGADQILVLRGADDPSPADLGLGERHRDVPIIDGHIAGETAPPFLETTTLIYLRADAVYHRASIQSTASRIPDLVEDGQAAASEDRRIRIYHLASPIDDPGRCVRRISENSPSIDAQLNPQWHLPITDDEAIEEASSRLWQACRKPEDGIIAQLLNRHISIAISKRLVATSIGPNHVTALTFFLGVAAAVAAAGGGYLGFLLAGLIYQTNSVIDGVDGELARVRYEFSFLGEWLDTISDDLADLFFYIGLGIGAWHTMAPPSFLPDTTWLLLGLSAATGKLLSMVVYYRWLIANGRGDLLAFQWSFEDSSDETGSPLQRLLSSTRYLFRKDFIVFAAMLCAIAGALPYLLFALAPGNLIVAASVLIQQIKGAPRP